MLDETIMPGRNVVDFARFQKRRVVSAIPRLCAHCGAALGDGESEDDCSSAGLNAMPRPAARWAFRAE